MCGPPVLLELLDVPSASHDKPCAGFHCPGGRANSLERVGERRGPNPVHLGGKAESRANGVQVRVDEPRYHRPALQVDHARGRACQLSEIGARAKRDNLPVLYRDRFANGELIVDRQHLSVHQNGVGALGHDPGRPPKPERDEQSDHPQLRVHLGPFDYRPNPVFSSPYSVIRSC